MSGYTKRKVFQSLADALDSLGDSDTVAVVHIDRYSVQDGLGIASQIARHAAHYPDDQDVQDYRTLAEDAFGTHPGTRKLAPADVHHTLTDRNKSIGLARIGATLFVRVEMSAVARTISRPDGEDENAYTTLVMALLNHHHALREVRWFGDVTRFARDAVNASLITRKLRERHIAMRLSGVNYDLADDAQALLLGVQSAVGAGDNPQRQRKLLGARLLKASAGGAIAGEGSLPYGYLIERRESGQPVRSGEKGLSPIPDTAAMPALRTSFEMFAAGDTYPDICAAMSRFEKEGSFKRRVGAIGFARTFSEALHDNPHINARAAVKRIFAPTQLPKWMPHARRPTNDSIERYVAGEDPEELFDISQRLWIARVELIRTGIFLRVLRNEIRQRGFVLHGFPAIYLDEADEFGYFQIKAPWPLPQNPQTGRLGWGIDDTVCRLAGARVLRGIDGPRKPTGSRAHRARGAERRAIQNIAEWQTDSHEYKVVARMSSGTHSEPKATAVLLQRPVEDAKPLPGRPKRGWGTITDHIVGTFSLPALCLDLGTDITSAVESFTDTADVAPAAQVALTTRDRNTQARTEMLARADMLEQQAAEDDSAAAGARKLAAMAVHEDEAAALGYVEDARQCAADAQRRRDEAARLRAHAADLAASDDRQPQEANISILAYLVAGFTHAADNRGYAPTGFGETADSLLTDWRFTVHDDDWIDYTCTLTLPLLTGENADIALAGRIPNIRSLRGRKVTRRDTLAQRRETSYATLVLSHGNTIEQAAAALGDDMSRTSVINVRLRPWLKANGVVSRGLRGALLDHPITQAQSAIYTHLTGDTPPNTHQPAATAAWTEHLAAVYRSTMRWGDAAVPDPLDTIRAVVATLAAEPGLAVTPAEIANIVGWTEQKVRNTFGTPLARRKGFQRPRYTQYVPGSGKELLTAIVCPHGRCRGVSSTVVLLPEVADSGYGVLCTTCRRAPNTDHDKWKRIVFPPAYLQPWTRQTANPSALSVNQQTILGQPGQPFDVEGTRTSA